MDVIFNNLKEQEVLASDVLSNVVKMNPLSEDEQKIHTNAKNCKLCDNRFEHDKVRHNDHIHWTILQLMQPATIIQERMKRQETKVNSLLWRSKEILRRC